MSVDASRVPEGTARTDAKIIRSLAKGLKRGNLRLAATLTQDFAIADALIRAADQLESSSALASPPSAESDDDISETDSWALEVLCRVFEDGADEGFAEWQAWYKPSDWLAPSRGLGAFIYGRLRDKRALSVGERAGVDALKQAMEAASGKEIPVSVSMLHANAIMGIIARTGLWPSSAETPREPDAWVVLDTQLGTVNHPSTIHSEVERRTRHWNDGAVVDPRFVVEPLYRGSAPARETTTPDTEER